MEIKKKLIGVLQGKAIGGFILGAVPVRRGFGTMK
jgi:hypothetical protein